MNNVPTLVRFIRQSGHHGDCSVATLAMLAGVMYEDALLAAAKVNPNVLHEGMTWPQIKSTARRLGLKTRTISKYDDDATGILHVSRVALGAAAPSEHVVLMWEGRIIDGNGELWLERADYLRHYGYEAKALLVVTED
jgi:ABC-type bacteriocin/lantibiotic exporter with double-glycine peptidase domain